MKLNLTFLGVFVFSLITLVACQQPPGDPKREREKLSKQDEDKIAEKFAIVCEDPKRGATAESVTITRLRKLAKRYDCFEVGKTIAAMSEVDLSLKKDADLSEKITHLGPLGVFKNIRRLNLSGNLLSSDNALMPLWDLPQLEALDLSHAEIKSVKVFDTMVYSSLKKLDLSGNALKGLDLDLSIVTPHLQILNLSSNSGIESLLIPLPNSLRDLDLSETSLSSLTKIRVVPKLTALRLRGLINREKLDNFSPLEDFTKLQTLNLEKVKLSDNVVEQLNKYIRNPELTLEIDPDQNEKLFKNQKTKFKVETLRH